MARSAGPSFVLTLKLNTSPSDEAVLAKRFFYAFLMKNRLIRHAKKALSTLRQDKEYRALMSERKPLVGKTGTDSKEQLNKINESLKQIRIRYGVSEYQFHAWIQTQQHRYAKQIDSLTAQKIATQVWKSVEEVLFRKGKTIHFQKLDNFLSLEGKNNVSGMRFKNGRLYWNGLVIQPQIRKEDDYAREALLSRVKYCRIVRKPIGITWHYYLQLILEGTPPQKYEAMTGRVGVDPGIGTEAVYSEHGCLLVEIAPNAKSTDAKVRRIQRKMDRSRRANNPDHYHPDGRIKRTRKPWVNSKTYKRDRMRLKTIRRKNKDAVKQAEESLANEILSKHGSNIVAEKMNYKALQARAKEDRVNKKGKHLSKKRFGKSISRYAPARFLNILSRKLAYQKKEIFFVNTWKFKASQYDHVVGDYKPVSLADRSKTVGGHKVQRDLYSAFLLWSAKSETEVDRSLCQKGFPMFLKHQEACIRQLLTDGKTHSSSFGLKDFVTN